jgi:HlyD family secretion protein
MKRTVRVAGIIVVVAVLTGAAYLRFFAQPTSAASTANLNTATVQRGTLAATVNSAGNIAAAQTVVLNFQQTGVVQKVNAQVGDQVKAGQVLATLDTTNLQLQVQTAQINLKVAQDNLAKARNPNTAQDLASARAALAAAQANYDKLAAPPTASDVAAARAAVAGAQAAYAAAQKTAGTGNSQLDAAAATVQKAQQAVQAAQAAYDKVAGAPGVGASPQAVALQGATTDYQAALAAYQTLQATTGPTANSTVQQAASALAQAQANLTKVLNPVTQNDLTSSQALVTQAQDNLDKLLAGSDANTLDIAQNAVDQANVALQQAQLQLQQAQIVAPFDAVVTAVGITPGQSATSSTAGAIQVADLHHLQIVVNMAEVDVTKVRVGQDAQITLDALPNAALTGKVSLIAPAGVLTQGVVNYPVTIDVTNPPASVKSGMTANLNVVIAQHSNVLMVPNRAVRTAAASVTSSASVTNRAGTTGSNPQGTSAITTTVGTTGTVPSAGARSGSANGGQGGGAARRPSRSQYVTVLRNGQQVQVAVQTGLSNDTMTEIVSGLNEGDVVVLNATTTTTVRTGGGVGLPGVGRIGG